MPMYAPLAVDEPIAELSKILELERAQPCDTHSGRIIVFEYLPRYTSANNWAHKWVNPGEILAILKRQDHSLLHNILLAFLQAAGGSCYIFSTWLTGWAHAQLVVLERVTAGTLIRGTIFGGTKNEERNDGSDEGYKMNVPHPKHGDDWTKTDGAEHRFAGHTTLNNTEITIEANAMLERWKRRGMHYGLTYYNCERFCQDLAATICTPGSRRSFLLERYGAIDTERIAELERYAAIDDSPGDLYYYNRTDKTQGRINSSISKAMVILIMVVCPITLIAWLSGAVVDNFDDFGWGWVFIITGFGSLRICLHSIDCYISYRPIFALFQLWPSQILEHKRARTDLQREYGLRLRRPWIGFYANDRPLFYFLFPFTLVIGVWSPILGSQLVIRQLETLHW